MVWQQVIYMVMGINGILSQWYDGGGDSSNIEGMMNSKPLEPLPALPHVHHTYTMYNDISAVLRVLCGTFSLALPSVELALGRVRTRVKCAPAPKSAMGPCGCA
jgi:hypothetical protein